MNKDDIKVTGLIVCYNAEKYIENSIESLLRQKTSLISKFEIIIVDGMSVDGTPEIILRYKENYPDLIKVYYNKKRTLAPGWNLGILESQGDYIFRIDAHATVAENYIESNLKVLLDQEDVIASGGVLKTYSSNQLIPTAISLIQSTKFGVGNSDFRTTEMSKVVDTVPYGLYRKHELIDIGLFNEEYTRNQDNEMHARLRDKGWNFYLNAETESIYYSRDNLSTLIKQAYGNGKWNVKMLNDSKKSFKLRYFVPFIFVIYLLFELILYFAIGRTFLINYILILYILMGTYFSYKKSKQVLLSIFSVLIYFIYHTSYGVGSLSEFLLMEGAENKYAS